MAQVKIGPEFFAKSKRDYANWRWALVREFAQNSIDCGSSQITFDVSYDGQGKTTLVVSNDGTPMTEDILVNKLLSLGSSGKNFQGTVGGFGKAKEILYFCHDSYRIETGELVCIGSGAQYDLDLSEVPFNGTRSTIVIEGNHQQELQREIDRFIRYSNVNRKWIVNGVDQGDCRLAKGFFRRELPFGRVYTNKQHSGLLLVRIAGTPMFYRWVNYPGCVILELDGSSLDSLQSNRDSLQWDQSNVLNQFVNDLSVNKKKALERPRVQYLRYEGSKLQVGGLRQKMLDAWKSKQPAGVISAALTLSDLAGSLADLGQQEENAVSAKALWLANEFVIKNETGKEVKAQYRPDSEKFCPYAFRLATIWIRLLLTLHEIFKVEDEFSVGFLFGDNQTVALHEKHGTYGTVYYINPVKIADGKWAKRFCYSYNQGNSDQNFLVMLALHELVHGMGYGDHNEDYASKLTDMAGKLLGEHAKLKKCFAK